MENETKLRRLDCQGEDAIRCPYCGESEDNSWEADGDGGDEIDRECGSCDKSFTYTRNVSVTYDTFRIKGDCDHNDEGTIWCGWCGTDLREEK